MDLVDIVDRGVVAVVAVVVVDEVVDEVVLRCVRRAAMNIE
tara:strand:+ start:2736 stop:2858 length:123 start_codon:yes stop_codon:yes gene_type:complete